MRDRTGCSKTRQEAAKDVAISRHGLEAIHRANIDPVAFYARLWAYLAMMGRTQRAPEELR
jgi:DNA-binding XRE family transcriptional regulator